MLATRPRAATLLPTSGATGVPQFETDLRKRLKLLEESAILAFVVFGLETQSRCRIPSLYMTASSGLTASCRDAQLGNLTSNKAPLVLRSHFFPMSVPSVPRVFHVCGAPK